MSKIFLRSSPLIALTLAVAIQAVSGQAIQDPEAVLAAKEWVRPPNAIAEAVLAPRYLNVTLSDVSPDKRFFLHEIADGLPTMERFALPFDELGGQFYDSRANRERRLTTRSNVGIHVISAADGSVTEVEVPNGARVSNAEWSPDGSLIAFYVHTDTETHIYVADPEDGDSRQVTRTPVLATMVDEFQWTSDGGEIATVLIPQNRAPRPERPRTPTGPQVKQTMDGENMLRTYASLMETPHDEALLEWHVTGQLATVAIDNRRETRIGAPAMIRAFDFSPTGQHARVTVMQRPFSYIVPVTSFGRVEEIWDRGGNVLATLDEVEMSTGIQGGDDEEEEDQPERRSLDWRADGAGLTFLQQEPAPEEDEAEAGGGQQSSGGARRADRVMLWTPPFDESSASVVHESNTRMSAARFSDDHQTLFVRTGGGGGGRGGFGGRGGGGGSVTEYAVDLSDPETRHTIVEYDSGDFYANPGSLLMTGGSVGGGRGGGGGGTVQTSADRGSVYLSGTRFNEDPMAEAPQAFLDRVEIRTGETERIWEANNVGRRERIVSVLDVDAGRFVVTRETAAEIEQSYLEENGARTQLTRNIDYTPDLTAARKERFTVARPDGFMFRVDVTLPPDYTEGEALPAMFWFYPREYTDQEDYDETGRTYDMNAFQDYGTRSMQYLARLGYAVVTPDAPIVGDQGQMNNNYEHDLRNNLAAVIDELDERGIIDRKRLGIGGHSYGAFGTANAMVHTPFFRAGIAGDGNYNRTFTPLSFQSERRIFWDAKDVYLGMSPFMFANNLTGALLMYHGLQDQNVGTAPDHTPRMFHALNGLGKDAAYYMYPFEEHGPATEETLLDLWARWTAWLQVHLAPTDRMISEEDQGM